MVKNKKINSKLIIRIVIPVLILLIIAAGVFLLVRYVPSVKEAFILATTVKPETFTELYFENHLSLPKEVKLFKENNFKFTIHNLENKDMEYPYEVYIEINGEKQMIDKDTVSIKNNEFKTITENFTITTPTKRAKVVVNLTSKNQQIDFWMGED